MKPLFEKMNQSYFRGKSGSNHFTLLILFILLLAVYWPIAFGVHTMKWDIMDQALPWRYFIGDALRHAHFPAWNPFLGLGYPAFADPQSGVWYPFTWFLGFLFGYNAYTIELEWFLHILIAATGMFYFAKHLKLSTWAAFLAAFVYASSGFMAGNAQHLHWIISAAWIPWLWLLFLKWSSGFEMRFAALTGLIAGLLLTGGYPAFAIVMAYVLAFTLLFKIIQHIRQKHFKLKKFIASALLLLFTFFLFSAGYLYSCFLALAYLAGNHITLEQALLGSYSSQSFITLFFPMTIGSVDHYFATDIAMRNMYAGILVLVLAACGLLLKPGKRQWFMLLGGIFALVISLGVELPFRTWLYYYWPLMDTFQFPALFRLFVFIPLVLVAAYGFDQIKASEQKNKIAWICMGIGLIWLAAALYGAVKERGLIPDPYQNNFLDILAANFEMNILHWQWMAWLPVGMVLLLSRIAKGRFLLKIIPVAVVLEIIITAQFQLPITALSEARTHTVNQSLRDATRQVQEAPGIRPMNALNEKAQFIFPIWYNLGVFYHVPTIKTDNPFVLKGFNAFSESANKDSLMAQSLAAVKTAKGLWIPAPISRFTFNRIDIDISGLTGSELRLYQNHFPGWSCEIDEEKVEINKSEWLTVPLPEGSRYVVFHYKTAVLWLLVIIQFLTLLLSLIFVNRPSEKLS